MPIKNPSNTSATPPIYPPHQPETAIEGKGFTVRDSGASSSGSPSGRSSASFSNAYGSVDQEYYGDPGSRPSTISSPAKTLSSFDPATKSRPSAWGWDEIKSRIKQAWANLSDDEVDYYHSNRDRFFTAVHNRYGMTKDEAQNRLAEWEKDYTNRAA